MSIRTLATRVVPPSRTNDEAGGHSPRLVRRCGGSPPAAIGAIVQSLQHEPTRARATLKRVPETFVLCCIMVRLAVRLFKWPSTGCESIPGRARAGCLPPCGGMHPRSIIISSAPVSSLEKRLFFFLLSPCCRLPCSSYLPSSLPSILRSSFPPSLLPTISLKSRSSAILNSLTAELGRIVELLNPITFPITGESTTPLALCRHKPS